MVTAVRYRVNRPRVIAQEIDGEVVAIHLETGNYYSLLESGATAWEALESSADLDTVVGRLTQRYEGAPEEMAEPVGAFLEQLQAEGLIVPVDSDAASDDGETPSITAKAAASVPREAFKAPMLEKFDDMQDLILLDPVHEVTEEQGWPHAK